MYGRFTNYVQPDRAKPSIARSEPDSDTWDAVFPIQLQSLCPHTEAERRVNTASEPCWSIDVFARTHVPKLVCMHWMGPNKREVCRCPGIREVGDFIGC
jgi:hypothetical protein